ncbi:MAG TPA: tetratricopeptide repeat protein [Candidatus Acidoferrales bacterium]|nr:tetratricopeptide repeat protein [Candidatus Acidoferrales bacterium]
MRRTLTAILLLTLASFTYSQSLPVPSASTEELNKLRIAQALEQAGEYEKALDFYLQLHQSSPDNFVYFDGLRRVYMNLKRYESAKELLNDRLQSDPSNVVMLCQLGDAYFKNGQQDSALVIWNKALTIDPKNPNVYKAVANTMAENRLFDKAIDVYRNGEVNSNQTFTNEIARLYFLNANYAGSLRELLKQLKTQQTTYILSNIEVQIASYGSSKEALNQFTGEMEKQVVENPDNRDYRRLLSFIYMEKKNYAAAYTAYKWLDNHSSAPGSELLQFAVRAYNDEAYEVASNAYKEVSTLSKNNSIVVQGLYGYANSLQELGENKYTEGDGPCSTTDTLAELDQALSTYETIIEQYPNTQFLSSAVLNSVGLKMKYFHDFAGAGKLLSDHRDRAGTDDWTMARIRLCMMEGKFQDAFNTSLGVIQSSPAADESVRDKIKFQAALALYYLGNYDSSAFYLSEISSNPMSDAANDAIQLLNTITNNRGNPAALREFASASAMEESDKIPEAASALEKILNEYPNVPLADNARFDLASDYCRMGNVDAALKNYSLLAEDSTGIFADRADLRICRIYQTTLRQNEKAISEYEDFLVRFPNSIYQNRVREILRNLLGEDS